MAEDLNKLAGLFRERNEARALADEVARERKNARLGAALGKEGDAAAETLARIGKAHARDWEAVPKFKGKATGGFVVKLIFAILCFAGAGMYFWVNQGTEHGVVYWCVLLGLIVLGALFLTWAAVRIASRLAYRKSTEAHRQKRDEMIASVEKDLRSEPEFDRFLNAHPDLKDKLTDALTQLYGDDAEMKAAAQKHVALTAAAVAAERLPQADELLTEEDRAELAALEQAASAAEQAWREAATVAGLPADLYDRPDHAEIFLELAADYRAPDCRAALELFRVKVLDAPASIDEIVPPEAATPEEKLDGYLAAVREFLSLPAVG